MLLRRVSSLAQELHHACVYLPVQELLGEAQHLLHAVHAALHGQRAPLLQPDQALSRQGRPAVALKK